MSIATYLTAAFVAVINKLSWLVDTDMVDPEGTMRYRAAQSGDVLNIVQIGLVIILGILIYSEVQTSLPTPSNSELSNASSNATGDYASTMELAPVVMIVIVAVVVLSLVRRFRA